MDNWQERIGINPEIRFGKPCIEGTRITVGDILAWLSQEMTQGEIVVDFPELEQRDILAALAYASRLEETTRILATA